MKVGGLRMNLSQKKFWKSKVDKNDIIIPDFPKRFTVKGKWLSEALVFASTNPQYDDRLFIKLQVEYIKIPSLNLGENMLCTEIVSDIQNNFCT